MQTITVLGATGSIGRSTLDVVARHPDRFRVCGLTAARKTGDLAELCAQHRAEFACVADASLEAELKARLAQLGANTRVMVGPQGLVDVASLPEVDCVMAAIVGAAGLAPTLAAARAGKRVLLANKEALVMAGPVFMDTVRKHGAELLPIDSEHNAIFQCLPASRTGERSASGLRRILLTGSGGPFRTRSRSELRNVTPDEACAHPKWVMGRKISVDSATMMNKGLEVIEAHWLFNEPADKIEVVVHPQSVVHSMVEYADGSVLAQLGNPDMRTPIAQALAYPMRIEAGVPFLDVFNMGPLTFEQPDFERFPALRLAYQALRAAGTAPAILNAANEVAVARFLQGALAFLDITTVIEETMQRVASAPVASLEGVIEADATSRARAEEIARAMGTSAA